MEASLIRANLQRLEHNRKVIEDLWTDVERYVCPYRGKFYEPQVTEGEFQWFRPHRMDDTAVRAHNRLAAMLQSKMTPSAFQWFSYRFADKQLRKRKPWVAWTEAVSELAFRELQNSLFGESMGEFYSDFTSFHSAYIGRELPSMREWQGLDFKCLPLKECFAERDHRGRIVRFYRKMTLSVLQMVEKFGVDNIPELYQKRWRENEQAGGGSGGNEVKYPVIFCVYKRDIGGGRGARAVAPQARPFGYKYIDYNSLEPFGEEGGYYAMPIYYVVYRKSVGSEFGHGPAHEAMSDIKSLNRALWTHYRQVELQVNPPSLTTEDNLITDLDLSDGGLTVVEDVDGTKPYFTGGRLDISYEEIGRLQEAIEKAFHIDQFFLKESPAMTATEVGARTRKEHETIGPPVENLKAQALKPLLMDIFDDMVRFGRVPEPPEGLDPESVEIEIEYFGSMALVQKADQATGIERTFGVMAGMAEQMPEILDVFDPDEIAREHGALSGAPASIYRSEAEIQGIREERRQQQEAMRQAEQAKTEAEAAEKAAGAVNTLTPGQGARLAEVMGGLG